MKIKIFADKFSENKTDGLVFEPHTNFRIIKGCLEFGDTNHYRQDGIARMDVGQIKNFEMLMDFKMVDDYGNDTWWMGIKSRSTDNYLGDGYLVYIRSNGNIAVYTAAADLPNSKSQITRPILNRKISLKIRIVDNKFSLEVSGNKAVYEDGDSRLLRSGFIYIYANHTKNKIYRIKIWRVIKITELLANKLFLAFLFLLLLAMVVIAFYHFSPAFVNTVIKDPRFQLWSGIK